MSAPAFANALRLAASVQARLATALAGTVAHVGNAADLAAAAAGLMGDAVHVWVVPQGDEAQASDTGTMQLRQPMGAGVMTIIGAQLGGPQGAEALAALTPVTDAVVASLLGWVPEGFQTPLEYRSGRLLRFDLASQDLLWGLAWETERVIRA